ncbi:MAG: hypothetical protein EOM34_14220 [Clostridia bacterium]|nr:hypothetical protein [Clostridia bacterium]
MRRIFIVINGASRGSWGEQMWQDVIQSPKYNAFFLPSPIKLNNKLLYLLFKIHNSNTINMKFSLPFKNVWDSFSVFPGILDRNDENYIVFQTGIKLSDQLINLLKKDYNCKIALYMPDTIKTIFKTNNKKKIIRFLKNKQVDYVYSFDKHDCVRFGFKFYDFYSKTNLSPAILKYDACYVGNCRQKDRIEIINYIADNIKNGFYSLTGLNNKDMTSPIILRNKYMTYQEYLNHVNESRCIVDIVNFGQDGLTLRAKEAIVYNKKLLTNNSSILSSEYYDTRYIQIFKDIQDIDFQWIYENTDVEYNYKGDFSPTRIIEDMLDEKR